MAKVLIKKISPEAVLPSYAHHGDAGMDLYAVSAISIAPGARVKIATGIQMEIPDGLVGLIWDKSGLSINNGLKTLGGVVDSGYRGEIMVGVINLSPDVINIDKGHKVAQMIIQKREEVELEEAEALSDSLRGVNGFGSTGK